MMTATEFLFAQYNPTKVKLNSAYTAVVHKDSKEVEVGCQRIPFSAVEELYKAIQ